MANGRLNANDVELIYPSNNGQRCDWFGIKNDKQTKRIRILYNTIEDVYFDVVHEVSVNNRNKTVACLNSRGENVNDCPMCKAGYQQKVLMYIPVLDLDDNKIKIWTRSKGYLATIQGLMMRNNPLSGTVFEVMRNGAPRDPKTTYMFQPISQNDGSTVEMILSSLNATLPDQSSYMEVYDFNQLQIYTQNLESIQGNIPANRGGFNQFNNNFGQTNQFAQPNQFTQPNQYSAPYNNGMNYQQPVNNMPNYNSAPVTQYSPNNNYTVNESVNAPAPTQPMVPPTNSYAAPHTEPQTVPQSPINTPVRRPMTPPVPPTPPMPVNNANQTSANQNQFVGTPNSTPDDVPF